MTTTVPSYKGTAAACYIGYVTQAAIVNMPPLLFIIFSTRFGIALDKISLLITVNFATQMLVDLLSSKFLPLIGYRTAAVLAHVFGTAGLIAMGVLPFAMPAYPALVIAFLLMALGGGLDEVLISPIIDAIPSDNKAGRMSFLHSFYCWGAVAVILFTTIFNFLLPDDLWYVIPLLWAVLPLSAVALFAVVPIPLNEEESGGNIRKLFGTGLFWLMLALMLCGGAAEQAIAQWASLFTETGLGVSKAVGDVLGAGLFAALMGVTRLLYGLFGQKLPLRETLMGCAVVNVAGLLITSLADNPVFALVGCALCGISIGLAWPGALSLASQRVHGGGTAMFALLALGGDIGCTTGPLVVGVLGSHADVLSSPLKSGILYAVAFPVLMLVILLAVRRAPKQAMLSEPTGK